MTWVALLGSLTALFLAAATVRLHRRLERVARAEHEVRGPLAALALGVEQVRRGRSGAELAGLLEAQLDRCHAGLGDLAAALGHDVAIRPAGAVDRRAGAGPPRVTLETLAHHTAAGWAAVASDRGRRLRLDWRAGPVTVTADRGRLAQALGNLLSNAIEHGGGEVALRGRRVGDGVRIEVVDAGVRSERTGSSRERAPGRGRLGRGGSSAREHGHGLAIASRAIEESGGRLQVKSGEGGTTAILELPLDDR